MYHESLLMVIFGSLLLLTIATILFPLRHSKRLCGSIFVLLLVGLPILYQVTGGWKEWHRFCQQQRDEQKAKLFLTKANGPQGVINRLKKRLQKDPSSSKGWYLLGRLYGSQGQWLEAENAFKHAYDLDPKDALVAINYAQSTWQVHGHQAHIIVDKLFNEVFLNYPKQPDALALRAQYAFESGDYVKAIDDWQTLLELLPNNSEEANLIRQAIAQAHQKESR